MTELSISSELLPCLSLASLTYAPRKSWRLSFPSGMAIPALPSARKSAVRRDASTFLSSSEMPLSARPQSSSARALAARIPEKRSDRYPSDAAAVPEVILSTLFIYCCLR